MTESKKFVTNDERLGLEMSALRAGIGAARVGMVCSPWCPTKTSDANLRHDIECVVGNTVPRCSYGDCSEEAMARKSFANGLTAWLCRYDLAVGEKCDECGGGSAGVRIEVNGEDGGHTRLHLCFEHADRWTCQVEGCGEDFVRAAEFAVYRDGLGYLRCRKHISTPRYSK